MDRIDALMFKNAKEGDYYFSKKPAKSLTSYAVTYGKKITTEKILTVNTKHKTEQLTKVVFV